MDKNNSDDGSLTLLEIEKNSKDKFKIIFDCIYEKSIWGDNSVKHYNGGSGDGSDLSYNLTTYVPFLKTFLLGHQIKSVVDLGCGDFVCGPYIYSDIAIEYTGYDTYQKIIDYNRSTFSASKKYTFHQLDIFNEWDKIAPADVCILKDVLQHWRTADIYTFLDAIVLSKKFKYIIICNCCDQVENNVDLYVTGGFRKLSANFFPLQRYDPIILYKYHTKEISLIVC
jgi:SAM-dependent methyltransferase